jgi:amino acid adenylation domain-containing protein
MPNIKKINPGLIEDVMPLTPMQEGLLFHYLKEPGRHLYTEQLCLEIKGIIDINFFQEAWQVVINSNQALRTLFRWEKIKNPVQIVLKKNPLKLKFYDFSDNGGETEKRVEKLKEDDRKAKFYLHEIPFRVTVGKTAKDHYVVLISSHHILYDGWSNGIILQELLQVYNDLILGKSPVIPTKKKFKEFVQWIRGRDCPKEENHWKKYFQGFVGPTGFVKSFCGAWGPEVYSRIESQDPRSEPDKNGYYRRSFSSYLEDKLRGVTEANKLTLAAIFYCAWGILQQKYTHQDDVVFGTTVSGRPPQIKDIENLVGLFLNTLPLRLKTDPGDKIGDLLSKVNHMLTEREEYQNTPLTEIKKYCQFDNKEALFDSIVVVENYPIDKNLLDKARDFSIQSFSVVEMNNYDLTVEITVFGDMELQMVYRQEVLAEEVIAQIAANFLLVLEQMLADLEKGISSIEIQLPIEPNRSRPDMAQTMKAPELLGSCRRVKINDHWIELAEIEAELHKHEKIKEAVVVARQSSGLLSWEGKETYLQAYYVVKSPMTLSVSQLRVFLAGRIPGFMIPSYFVQIENIPLTDNGQPYPEAFLTEEGVGFNARIKPVAVEPTAGIEKTIADIWKEVIQLETVGIHENFFDTGGNSLNILRILSELKRVFDCQINLATMFRFPTISAMSQYLEGELKGDAVVLNRDDKQDMETKTKDEGKGSETGEETEKSNRHTAGEIAVIGMAGRFPGASNIDAFWENLKNGICSIAFFTDQELEAAGVPAELVKKPGYVKAKGIMDDVEYFDASFFNYTSREAELMNPQFRILHEYTWEALENAGYNPETYGEKIGLFAGLTDNLYWLSCKLIPGSSLSEQFEVLNLNSNSFCTLLSYKMNLTGPSVTLQTACSTSLAAIHQACRSLLSGECRTAIAGGVSILFPIKSGYVYQSGMVKSPDGFCRAFDAEANGTIGGDGVAVVVLKLLENALADGDHIEAIIKGTAINNDGARKVGYTAPSVEGQVEVISEAMAMGQIEPETIGYVEAHGTGTLMGDPIEIESLKLAFHSNKKGFCKIGSVKTNIGHLDAAAGAAGFIKTVLSLKHKLIPPSLHFKSPNPKIDFENSPFRVNTEPVKWKAGSFPRRAGVSSFGIGGTNVHIILEEAPEEIVRGTGGREYRLIVLSAKSESVLEKMTENLAGYFKKNPGINLDDTAYTLQTGRKSFPYRRMLVSTDRDEALEALAAPGPGKTFTHLVHQEKRPVVFMFPGLGGQYQDMGLDLYCSEPRFRQEMDRCFEILKPLLGYDIKKIFYHGDSSLTALNLDDFEIAQAALFIFEYALASLLMSWGIRPQAMVGYSFGEYTAACVSGVFSLEDALKLVVLRGRLIRRTPPSAMISVPLPASDLTPFLAKRSGLFIAIDNGLSCVVSGLIPEVTALEEEMKKKKVICMRLPASHALHTPLLSPILKELQAMIDNQLTLDKPRIPYISNVTGDWITHSQATNNGYWSQHLSGTVRFDQGVKKLMEEPGAIFLEIGPGRDLSTLLLRYTQDNSDQQVLPMVRNANEKVSDVYYLVKKIGLLWLYGVPIDWQGFHAHQRDRQRRMALPTYPFERQRFPLGDFSLQAKPGDMTASPRLTKKPEISDWFYVPAWKPSVLQVYHHETVPFFSCCLLFIDEGGFGQVLAKQLETLGCEVFCVKSGSEYKQDTTYSYTLHPGTRDHYEKILADLQAMNQSPRLILHLWGITHRRDRECDIADSIDITNMEQEQETGFYSLLNLVQAIGRRSFSRKETFRLMIVTNNMQIVPGQEELFPLKTVMMGAIKVIPKEYPNIRCSSIDIVLPQPGSWQQERLYRQLLEEIVAATTEMEIRKGTADVIALRGGERLVQTYEAVSLKPSERLPQRLRPKGVYLVTGGLGGIGLEIAKFLAASCRVNMVLTGRTQFPPREEWDRLLAGESNAGRYTYISPGISKETENIYRLENQLTQTYGIRGIKNRNGLEETANELCCALIYDYLKRSHIDMARGLIHEKTDLMKQLKILPKFCRFFDFFIRVLQEDAWIRVEGSRVEFILEPGEMKDPRRLLADAEQRYPSLKGTFRLLDYCASRYREALSGEIEAINVLFPDNQPVHLQEPYRNREDYSTRLIYCRLLQELVFRVLEKWRKYTRREIKILEIGAGTGTLTRHIAPELRTLPVRYYFTDIGKYFLLNARKDETYAGLSHMVFEQLDISKDPQAQGYDLHDFDIILGLNVVHATPYIAVTLGYLKKLLAPSGMIALVETVQASRWLNMVDGLAEGWWYFQDDELRKDSPLMDLERWMESFRNQGFKDVTLFPHPEDVQKRLNSDTGMVVAEQDPAVTLEHCGEEKVREFEEEIRGITAKINEVKKLEALGSEVLIIQADVTDLEQMQAVAEETKSTLGPINGVIHCAGELDFGGVIHGRTKVVTERILGPKVRGTLVLDRVFNDTPLDFFVLCSSLSSIVVPLGQVGHSAANAFLDAFAHYRSLIRGRFTVAINWDSWKEVGSSQAAGDRWSQAYDFIDYSISDFALSPAEGIEIFKRALEHTLPQVVVCTRDLNELAAQQNIYGESVLRETGSPAFTTQVRQLRREDLGVPFVPPQNDLQQTLVQLWEDYLGIRQVGIRDDFYQLGVDSLVAITLSTKIHRVMDVQVPISVFFSHPSVERLAQYISDNRSNAVYTGLEPVEKKEYYALSSAQKRLYVLQCMRPDSSAYNESSAWILEGELRKEKLEQTFKKLVQRHESFRTAIINVHGEPFQQIHDCEEFEIEYYDTGNSNREQAIGNKEELMPDSFIKDFIRPFALSRAPLLRVVLIKTGHGVYWLAIDMHHIITDGMSHGILIRDFLHLYAEEKVAPLTVQYRDYAEWQYYRQNQDDSLRQQEVFWLEEFKGEIPVLNIPLDYPRPAVQELTGNTLRFEVDAQQAAALRQVGIGEGATLFMVLLSLYTLLLGKLSGQEDIVVGTPTAGRQSSEIENVIGMFANTLGLRNYPTGQKTYAAFLREVKERAWKAFENQDYQYEKLVDRLALERDTGRNPLFDVEFSFENMEIPAVEIPGLTIRPIVFENAFSKFDLILTVVENKENLDFSFTYGVKLFRKESVGCLIDYFKTIITGMIEDPAQHLQDIDLMSETEKKWLLWNINDTLREYPGDKTLHYLFEEQVEKNPDHVALVYMGHEAGEEVLYPETEDHSSCILRHALTYRELNESSNRVAHVLGQKGVAPDKIVGIMMERCVEMIMGILGILKAGGAYLPIDPQYPQERIDYMLKDSGAKILITTGNLAKEGEKVRRWEGGKILFEEISKSPKSSTYPLTRSNSSSAFSASSAVKNLLPAADHWPPATSLAYVIYTSGSTGRPKGVMIAHQATVNYVWWAMKTYIKQQVAHFALFTSLSFDLTVTSIFAPLCSGNTIIIYGENRERLPVEMVLHEDLVEVVKVTPSHLRLIKNLKTGVKSHHIKRFIVGGEALDSRLAEEIYQKFDGKVEIYNEYGPTEATVGSMIHRYDPEHDKRPGVPIGTPVANTKIFILDRHQKPVPVGVTGELYIAGTGLARGYLNQPELNAEKFCLRQPGGSFRENRPLDPHKSFLSNYLPEGHLLLRAKLYKTGDLGRWLPDGTVEFLGRADRQMKIRGYRIEPMEIEKRLEVYCEIDKAIVIPREEEEGNKKLCAYLVSKQEFSTRDLRDFLLKELPEYMVPSYFVRLEEIPLTAHHKIDLDALPSPLEHTLSTDVVLESPNLETEQIISDIWCEVLGLKEVGKDDNFFEYGGNSLEIIKVNSKLKEFFNRDIPILSLFKYPTVRSLAAHLNSRENKKTISKQEIEESVAEKEEAVFTLFGDENG